MKIKQAIQVGSNVTDIFKLPCIKSVRKCDDRNGLEWIEYVMADGGIVECGDWLCEMEDGKWQPMSGEEDITEGGDNQGGNNNNPPSGELEG